MRTRMIVIASVLGLAVLFAGCTQTSSPEPLNTSAASTEPTDPPTATIEPTTPDTEITAGWIIPGILAGVVTAGSGTCIPHVDSMTPASASLTVTLKDPEGDGFCTADLNARVTGVGTRNTIDTTVPVSLVVTYNDVTTTIELAAAEPMPDEMTWQPAAGYVGPNTIGLVTFGSSSCAPLLSSVEPGADATTLAVTLAPPAVSACTDDLAPRILTIHAEPGVKKLSLVQDNDMLIEIDVVANSF